MAFSRKMKRKGEGRCMQCILVPHLLIHIDFIFGGVTKSEEKDSKILEDMPWGSGGQLQI